MRSIRLSLWSVSALYWYLDLKSSAHQSRRACTTEPSMKMTKPRLFSSPASLPPRCRLTKSERKRETEGSAPGHIFMVSLARMYGYKLLVSLLNRIYH